MCGVYYENSIFTLEVWAFGEQGRAGEKSSRESPAPQGACLLGESHNARLPSPSSQQGLHVQPLRWAVCRLP